MNPILKFFFVIISFPLLANNDTTTHQKALQGNISLNRYYNYGVVSLINGNISYNIFNEKSNISRLGIEQFKLNYTPTFYGGRNLTSGVSIFFERDWTFLKRKKLNPYIGIRSSLYGGYNSFYPHVTTSFPSSFMYMGLNVSPSFGLIYNKSEKIYYNVAFLFPLGYSVININKSQNPAVPVRNQRTTNINAGLSFRQFIFQIGIGVKI